jgi:protein TonB
VRVPDSNPNAATMPPPPPKPTPTPRKMTVSGGVLNGKAVSKPQPSYPEAAKAARVSGVVAVEVLVDEEGKVIEAKALSGNPLLRDPAVEAARKARFAPTRLRGEAVRVRGVITFNFALQ